MKNVKTWWLEKGWPWLKENWWVLLILPVLAFVALGMLVWNRPVVSIVEPLAEADARARREAEARAAALEAEKVRLDAELSAIRKEHDSLQRHMEERLDARVEELRNDPNKLREAMLAAGRRTR